VEVMARDEFMVTCVCVIEALPVVSLLPMLTKKAGSRVTLRCFGSCGDKRCWPVCITKTSTTLLATASPTDRGVTRREVRHCCGEEGHVHCGGSSRYEAARKAGG